VRRAARSPADSRHRLLTDTVPPGAAPQLGRTSLCSHAAVAIRQPSQPLLRRSSAPTLKLLTRSAEDDSNELALEEIREEVPPAWASSLVLALALAGGLHATTGTASAATCAAQSNITGAAGRPVVDLDQAEHDETIERLAITAVPGSPTTAWRTARSPGSSPPCRVHPVW
jgi:hypothetical protein